MIKLKTAFAAMMIGLFLFLPGANAYADDWEEFDERDGVRLFRQQVEGTKLLGWKGLTTYEQDMRLVLGVLLDNDHRIEWVDRLATNHIVEAENEFDYILYQAFELPAIFSDRDYVYHGVATYNEEDGTVMLHMQSVEHPEAPETVGVRAELVNSRYLLTPLENGGTQVEVEILTDPKGMMPAWFVNLITKTWPAETLNGIRGQFEKDHVKPHKLPGEEERLLAAQEAEEAAKAAEEAAKAAEEGAEQTAENGEGEDTGGVPTADQATAEEPPEGE